MFQPVNIGVWCSVGAKQIVGSVFIENVNCKIYVQIILAHF
jgi:hypothetical protein